jgi:hypothetical protein
MLIRSVPGEHSALSRAKPAKWDKCGWLRKYTVLSNPVRVVTQLYKLRFFTLEGRILTYYKSEEGELSCKLQIISSILTFSICVFAQTWTDASLGFGRNRRGRFGVNNAMIHIDRLLVVTDEHTELWLGLSRGHRSEVQVCAGHCSNHETYPSSAVGVAQRPAWSSQVRVQGHGHESSRHGAVATTCTAPGICEVK